jgi:hypothetical protein
VSTIYPEILSCAQTLYLAPVATAFPLIDAAPGTFDPAWVAVGTRGADSYDSAGVTDTFNQTIASFTPVGTTAQMKAWRTDESIEIAIVLADVSPAMFGLALNNAPVDSIAATSLVAGEDDIPLLQGIQVEYFALLVRFLSSVDDSLNAQLAIPACYQSANPAPVAKKGAPMELALTFTSLLDPNGGGFGQLQIQTAAKT